MKIPLHIHISQNPKAVGYTSTYVMYMRGRKSLDVIYHGNNFYRLRSFNILENFFG